MGRGGRVRGKVQKHRRERENIRAQPDRSSGRLHSPGRTARTRRRRSGVITQVRPSRPPCGRTRRCRGICIRVRVRPQPRMLSPAMGKAPTRRRRSGVIPQVRPSHPPCGRTRRYRGTCVRVRVRPQPRMLSPAMAKAPTRRRRSGVIPQVRPSHPPCGRTRRYRGICIRVRVRPQPRGINHPRERPTEDGIANRWWGSRLPFAAAATGAAGEATGTRLIRLVLNL